MSLPRPSCPACDAPYSAIRWTGGSPTTPETWRCARCEHQWATGPVMLTSTEVVHALIETGAVGKLTVSGDNPVVITGPRADRDQARKVLQARGLHCTPARDQDEWARQPVRCGDHHASGVTGCTREARHDGAHHNGTGLTWGGGS